MIHLPAKRMILVDTMLGRINAIIDRMVSCKHCKEAIYMCRHKAAEPPIAVNWQGGDKLLHELHRCETWKANKTMQKYLGKDVSDDPIEEC